MPEFGFYPPEFPGSSAIGQFRIGFSPIGSVGFRWQDTILSQYANSPILLTMIESFSQYLDQAANMDQFFDLIWNIDTAQGFGLDIWGRILQVGRTLEVVQQQYFGFEEADNETAFPFNQAPFYSGQTITSNYNLSDTAYRTLLFAKALFNICDGSIPAINNLLMTLFPGRGNAFVEDGINIDDEFFGFAEAGEVFSNPWNQRPFYSGQAFVPMTMTYIFDFALTPVETAIVTQSGILPTPTGVTATIQINA